MGWSGNETETIEMPPSYVQDNNVVIEEVHVQVHIRYFAQDLLSPWSNIVAINSLCDKGQMLRSSARVSTSSLFLKGSMY